MHVLILKMSLFCMLQKKELNKQTKSISHCLHLTEVKAGC